MFCSCGTNRGQDFSFIHSLTKSLRSLPWIERVGCAKLNKLLSGGIAVDTNFLKAHAERCRSLAENADEFTKRRLLDLAATYDKRVWAAGPSAATRILNAPLNLAETAKQI
jgi:hypothetical protein